MEKPFINPQWPNFVVKVSYISPCRASRFSRADLFGDGGQQGLQILTLAKCSDPPL